MSNTTINGHTLTNRELLTLRTVVWLGIYGILFAVWGLRNAWPIELKVSIILLPATLVFAWQDYQANQFGSAILRDLNHWEFMIACLLMATGVASGVLLLLAIGWVCLGVVWLRPERDDFDWAEWFKLPFAFFLTVPVWLDLLGSRHDWVQHFASNLELGSSDAWSHVRIHVSILVSIYILGSGLRGSFFWRSLAIIPLTLLVVPLLAFTDGASTGWSTASKLLTWAFVPCSVLVFVVIMRLIGLGAPKVCSTALTEFIRKGKYQSHSVFLVSVVVGMQQYSFVEGWVAGTESVEIIIGVLCWVAVLCVIRARSPIHLIDLRSKVMLACSLFVLLVAEWTDTNALRHFSLGLVIVGAMSWRRMWPWLMYVAVVLTWTAGLPGTRMVLSGLGITTDTGDYLAKMFFFFGLLCMAVFGFQKPRESLKIEEESEITWQPAMRFAFILLILFLSFQTLASFWPADLELKIDSKIEPRTMRHSSDWTSSGFKAIEGWESPEDFQPSVAAYIAVPGEIPYRLNAPERILKELGWHVLDRKLVNHPLGQGVELVIERGSEEARVLYWWIHRGNAFANYMRGRRILWSGWHLSQRDFRLIILVSGDLSDDGVLEEFAATEDWFFPRDLE